jgi:drug/metabolite transporter (DMT)-like permease
LRVWLGLVLTTLAWAGTFHFAKYSVQFLPPAGAAVWRFIIAVLFLVPVVSWRERWDLPGLRRNAPELLFLGAVGIGGFQLGMFYGLQSSSAINAALIMALSPVFTVVIAAAIDRHRITARQWLGLLLSLLGVMLVTVHGDWQQLRALRFGHGDLLMLGGAFAWAVYSVVLRRNVRGLTLLQVSASTIVICAFSMLLGVALLDPAQLRWPPLAVWPAVLFMGVVGSGLAYLWWNNGVLKLGAARASLSGNLTPVFTVLIGVALGQTLEGILVAGAGLVIAGVVIATWT